MADRADRWQTSKATGARRKEDHGLAVLARKRKEAESSPMGLLAFAFLPSKHVDAKSFLYSLGPSPRSLRHPHILAVPSTAPLGRLPTTSVRLPPCINRHVPILLSLYHRGSDANGSSRTHAYFHSPLSPSLLHNFRRNRPAVAQVGSFSASESPAAQTSCLYALSLVLSSSFPILLLRCTVFTYS